MLALPAPRPQAAGGQGGDAPDPAMSRSDARMFAQAVKGRWPIPDALRIQTIDTLASIVSEPWNFDHRVVVTAAKVLLDADRINLDDEANAKPRPQITEDAGRVRVDFRAMTDADLDRFIEDQTI